MTPPRAPRRKRTGGVWDPAERPVYFVSTQTAAMANGITWGCRAALVDAHEVNPEAEGRDAQTLERWLAAGRHLLLDSGVHNLMFDHMRRTGATWDELWALSPETFPGYARLWRRYVGVMQRFGTRAWGYIELDIGTLEHKRETRARCEAETGLVPMPVFHLGSDPWAYFDELAAADGTGYDRVCVAGISDVDYGLRRLATLAEHAQHHPGLWIHLLGVTATQFLHAYPVQSADSSNWTFALQGRGYYPRVDLQHFGDMPQAFRHRRGVPPTDPAGTRAAERMSVLGHEFQAQNWRLHAEGVAELMGDVADDHE